MGAVLCTDYLPELEKLFELDSEITVFNHSSELLEKIRMLQSTPEVSSAMAQRGFEKTQRIHSVENRVHRFFAIVNQYLSK